MSNERDRVLVSLLGFNGEPEVSSNGATEAGPQDSESAIRLADNAMTNEDFERAARHYGTALRLGDPNSRAVHLGLARALVGAGDDEGAVLAFDRVLAVEEDAAILVESATSEVRIAGGIKPSLARLRRAVELSPTDPELFLVLARATLNAGYPKLATEEAENAIALEPDNVFALAWAGERCLEIGEPMRAWQHLGRLVELSPGDDRGHILAFEAQWRLAMRDAARASLTLALTLDPERSLYRALEAWVAGTSNTQCDAYDAPNLEKIVARLGSAI